MHLNEHLQQMNDGYLFTEIINRTQAFQNEHPEAHILRLGVGDITRPLPAPIVEAMHRAVDEMGKEETFHGYGLENGYGWLREAIIENDYRPRGVDLALEEVFISDGAGSDLGIFGEKPCNRERSHGLTAAGVADKAQYLAFSNIERDAV